VNIVNKLTLRHMKQNKRRTLVTIIGVIISVAMITAVSTLGVSFLDLLKRQVIATSGDWHVLYNGVNKEQIQSIANDSQTKTITLSQDKGFASIKDLKLPVMLYKPYIALRAYSDNGFSNFPITMLQGRVPQNPGEVIISKHFLMDTEAQYSIGDTIDLQLGERYLPKEAAPFIEQRSGFTQNQSVFTSEDALEEKLRDIQKQSYTIVGIIDRPVWENAWNPGYTFLTYIDESLLSATELLNVSVIVNDVNNKMFDHAEQLAKQLGIKKYSVNSELLRYNFVSINSSLVLMLYTLTAIIMTIIIVGSVSLIYNAFGISVADRSRYLGMLASVGATRRQKRNSVFFEGFFISMISIPIGLISGLVGLVITFWCINSMIQGVFGVSEPLLVKVMPETMLLAIVISLLTIFISTWLPAKRASNVSAIDAIRQSQDIKLSRKKVKTSKLVRKIFGIEAEIGLKNLKRNKRRYQITVFSLVISIILFLSVSYFTDQLKRSLSISNEGYNYDIMLGTDEATSLDELKNVLELTNVTSYNLMEEKYGEVNIDKKFLPPSLQADVNEVPEMLQDGKYRYNVYLYGMTDEMLTQYAKDNGIDPALLLDKDATNAIIVNQNTFYSKALEKQVEEPAILNPVGQVLPLKLSEYYEEKDKSGNVILKDREIEASPLHIVASADQFPMGVVKSHSSKGSLRVITSMNTMKKYIAARSSYNLYLTSSDPLTTEKEIYKLEELKTFYISNLYESRRKNEQVFVLISVFTYGFIALITLISMANILNTISTSIHLRKREFAMLKSMGMTSKGFNRMINYESIFYGIKALSYGLPLSLVVMYAIHRTMMNTFMYPFTLPWLSIGVAIIGVFIIVGTAMLYSSSKVRKDNIVDAIKQESI